MTTDRRQQILRLYHLAPRTRIVRGNIPASVERIVLRCLEKRPQLATPPRATYNRP